MDKKLENLKRQLNLALDRNDASEIVRLRKEILKLEGENDDLEELNLNLFDN